MHGKGIKVTRGGDGGEGRNERGGGGQVRTISAFGEKSLRCGGDATS